MSDMKQVLAEANARMGVTAAPKVYPKDDLAAREVNTDKAALFVSTIFRKVGLDLKVKGVVSNERMHDGEEFESTIEVKGKTAYGPVEFVIYLDSMTSKGGAKRLEMSWVDENGVLFQGERFPSADSWGPGAFRPKDIATIKKLATSMLQLQKDLAEELTAKSNWWMRFARAMELISASAK
jgi:hypothetical protein